MTERGVEEFALAARAIRTVPLPAIRRSEVGRKMERCGFIKGSGEGCKGSATGRHGLCWAHAPENAEQRSRQASRAARSKGNREVAALKGEIKSIISDVRAVDLDRNDAAVMIQGYRALKDFIELGRRVKETDDLVSEIEELKRGQWQAS